LEKPLHQKVKEKRLQEYLWNLKNNIERQAFYFSFLEECFPEKVSKNINFKINVCHHV